MEGKGSVDDDSFNSMDKEFEEVVKKLRGDTSLDKFRSEFEKLHGALRKSHDGEKRLMQKCRELNAELLANAAKVQSIMADGDIDETATAALQKEVEQAWKMVDTARENEANMQETIEQLRQEIASLNAMVEQGSGVAASHGEDITALLQHKKELTAERDKMLAQITTLRNEVADVATRQQAADSARIAAEQETAQLKEQIASKRAEAERESRKRDALEREINAYKADIAQRGKEVEARQADLRDKHEEVGRLQDLLHERRVESDELRAEQDALQSRVTRLAKEVEDAALQNRNAGEDNGRLKQDLKSAEEELSAARQESSNLQRMVEVLNKKLRQSDERRLDAEAKHSTLKGEMSSLQRDLDSTRRQVESDRKQLEDLTRGRDMLQRRMVQAGKDTQAQETLVKLQEASKSRLEQEIAELKEETSRQGKSITQLEKERDVALSDAAYQQQQCVHTLEEIKLAEGQIFEYKKKLAEADAKLRQQQSLYETVR